MCDLVSCKLKLFANAKILKYLAETDDDRKFANTICNYLTGKSQRTKPQYVKYTDVQPISVHPISDSCLCIQPCDCDHCALCATKNKPLARTPITGCICGTELDLECKADHIPAYARDTEYDKMRKQLTDDMTDVDSYIKNTMYESDFVATNEKKYIPHHERCKHMQELRDANMQEIKSDRKKKAEREYAEDFETLCKQEMSDGLVLNPCSLNHLQQLELEILGARSGESANYITDKEKNDKYENDKDENGEDVCDIVNRLMSDCTIELGDGDPCVIKPNIPSDTQQSRMTTTMFLENYRGVDYTKSYASMNIDEHYTKIRNMYTKLIFEAKHRPSEEAIKELAFQVYLFDLRNGESVIAAWRYCPSHTNGYFCDHPCAACNDIKQGIYGCEMDIQMIIYEQFDAPPGARFEQFSATKMFLAENRSLNPFGRKSYAEPNLQQDKPDEFKFTVDPSSESKDTPYIDLNDIRMLNNFDSGMDDQDKMYDYMQQCKQRVDNVRTATVVNAPVIADSSTRDVPVIADSSTRDVPVIADSSTRDTPTQSPRNDSPFEVVNRTDASFVPLLKLKKEERDMLYTDIFKRAKLNVERITSADAPNFTELVCQEADRLLSQYVGQ
jgi:hypothetical protein